MKGIDIVYHADNNTMELKDAPDDLLIGTDGDDYATYLNFQIIDDEGILDGFSPYVLFEVESRPMIGLDESYTLNLTQDLLNKARYGKLPFMLVFKGKESTIEIHSVNTLTLGIAHSIDADREVEDDSYDSELAIKYVEITYHAESRLMELTDMPDDQFVGTDGDDYATYLRFTMDDPDGLLTGYGARVEFDVSIKDENGDTYKPFIIIDESMSVPLIQRILSNVKYGAIPIQMAFKGTDSEGRTSQYYSLNKLRLSISDSIRALEGIDVNDRIDLNSVINNVEYNPKTATFSFRQIDGGSIAVQLSDLSEEHFEVPTKDDLEKLNKAQNGDTATTLDDGKWYKLYGDYSDPLSWKVMSPSVKAVDDHISDTDNPHNVTKSQIGLGNVDNTSDIDKPISSLTQEALDTKADSQELSELSKIVSEEIADRESSEGIINESISNHISDTNNPHNVTKEQLGLENVDNTSDVNKPISTATQEALDDKADKTTVSSLRTEFDEEVRVRSEEDTNIKADLDTKADKVETQNALNDKANKTDVETALDTKADKLATEQALDSKADKSIMETALGLKADKSDVEMALDTKADKTTVSSLSNTLTKEIQDRQAGDNTNATAISTHATNKSNPHNVTKEQVGLGNVDNTSDADKPISTATQNALNLKADKTEISSLYRPKGSVATVNDLPSNAQIGDVYDVQSTGMNYVWTGSKWDELGAIIDLSPYYTKTEVDGALSGKVSKSGDTMTGALCINTSSPAYWLINPEYTNNTPPSKDVHWWPSQMRDSKGSIITALNSYVTPTETRIFRLGVVDVNGTWKYPFNVVVNKDSTDLYMTAPTPSDKADNSTKIATTSWISTADCIVHKTGNETISGVKTLTGNLYLHNSLRVMPTASNTRRAVVFNKSTDGSELGWLGYQSDTGNMLINLISGDYVSINKSTPTNATSNEIATADWSLGKFVKKTGDTMSDNLTIAKDGVSSLILKRTDVNKDQPTYKQLGVIRAEASNGLSSQIEFLRNTPYGYLASGVIISAYNSTGTQQALSIYSFDDGVNQEAYVQHPSWMVGTNDNSDKSLTIKMANSLPSLLHSTGNETVAGTKVFTSKPIVRKAGYGSIDFFNTNANPNTVGSWALMHEIGFYGTDGTNDLKLGGYYISTDGSGNPRTVIQTRRVVDGETKVGELEICVKSDGSAIAYAPQPPQSANYTEIVTANWCNSKFVQKSGDTMTGTLTLQQGGWNNLTFKHTVYDVLNPSGGDERTLNICAYDVNTQLTTSLTTSNNTDYVRTYLASYGYKSDGTRVSSAIDIYANRDGTAHVLAPTLSNKADNSRKIPTTAWISTADCIVHKTGNETVAGVKTYTSYIQSTINSGTIVNATFGNYTNGDTPTVSLLERTYRYEDKAGTRIGQIVYSIQSTKQRNLGLTLFNESQNYKFLGIKVLPDGTFTSECCSTKADAIGNEIATADWVNNKLAGKVTISTSDPSGGSNGDIWFKYE